MMTFRIRSCVRSMANEREAVQAERVPLRSGRCSFSAGTAAHHLALALAPGGRWLCRFCRPRPRCPAGPPLGSQDRGGDRGPTSAGRIPRLCLRIERRPCPVRRFLAGAISGVVRRRWMDCTKCISSMTTRTNTSRAPTTMTARFRAGPARTK